MSRLFRQRQVRRSSRFTSRMRTSSRKRREYAATVYSTAIIRLILSGALAIAAARSWQAISAHAGDDIPLVARLVLPVVFLAGAFVTGRSAIRAFRSAWEMGRPDPRAERETAADPDDHRGPGR